MISPLRFIATQLLALLFFSGNLTYAKEHKVFKTPIPTWADDLGIEDKTEASQKSGAEHFVLTSSQYHLEKNVYLYHGSTEILSEAGVEQHSQLSTSFQPSYQTLRWHRLLVHRDGKTSDRLEAAEFKFIQRESGLEQQLYDGQITAHIILKDIRPGDIIEFCYSIKGANPVLDGHKHSFEKLAYGSFIGRVYRSVIWDSTTRKLQYQLHQTDQKPTREKLLNGLEKIIWNEQSVKAQEIESNTPYWFFDYPYIEFSDYESWGEYLKWEEKVHGEPDELPENLKKICEEIRQANPREEDQIRAALGWVKKEIRYLGSFFGNHTHAPYPLEKIYERRFGDCKDKGVLLVAMLQYLGFDAAPAFVDVDKIPDSHGTLPGHANFDHLIVNLNFAGETYWLDPTRTFQEGHIKDLYSSDYGYAFVLRPGQDKLTRAPARGVQNSSIQAEEEHNLQQLFDGSGGKGSLKSTTTYRGLKAEHMRRSLAESSTTSLAKNYLDFYQKTYPKIEIAEPLFVKDDKEKNIIVTIENYTIGALEDTTDFYTDAASIASLISKPSATSRKHPYRLRFPCHYEQIIKVQLPDGWAMTSETANHKLPELTYEHSNEVHGNLTTLRYKLVTKSDAIAPENFAKFKQAAAALDENRYQKIYQVEAVSEEKNYSYLVLSGVLIAGILTGLLIAIALWFWDPPARAAISSQYVGISGWLIFFSIGLVVAPFAWAIDITTFFQTKEDETLNLFGDYEGQATYLAIYCVSVFLEAILCILACLSLVLFFTKRTSFPIIWIVTTILGIITTAILLWWISTAPEGTHDGNYQLIGEFFRWVLWTAYFFSSTRVRATFRKQIRAAMPPPLPTPPPQSTLPSADSRNGESA